MVRREFTVANEHAYDRRSPVRWIVSHILRYPHLPLIAVLGNVATSGLYSVGSILIGRAFDLVAAPGATLAETAERLNPADASGARRVSFLCIELGDPGPDGALRAVGERHGGAKGYLLLDRKAIGLGTPVPAAPGARAK